jgi:hypothetical protein
MGVNGGECMVKGSNLGLFGGQLWCNNHRQNLLGRFSLKLLMKGSFVASYHWIATREREDAGPLGLRGSTAVFLADIGPEDMTPSGERMPEKNRGKI